MCCTAVIFSKISEFRPLCRESRCQGLLTPRSYSAVAGLTLPPFGDVVFCTTLLAFLLCRHRRTKYRHL